MGGGQSRAPKVRRRLGNPRRLRGSRSSAQVAIRELSMRPRSSGIRRQGELLPLDQMGKFAHGRTRLLGIKGTMGILEPRGDGPLAEFHVWWDNIRPPDLPAFRDCIDNARGERPVQRFLQAHPTFLIQHLGGGHGRWVLPQKRLGAEFVTDFVIGEKDSAGYHWTAVEMESPLAPMFTKRGDPSRHLTHAIRQIQDWRSWLHRNQAYAARDRRESGLGLTDITGDVKGLILISRRHLVEAATNERRRQMMREHSIDIHTYDFLIEAAQGRAAMLADRQTWCELDPAAHMGPPPPLLK